MKPTDMTRARIDRQTHKVARLSRELRFELLLLRRMRARVVERQVASAEAPAYGSLAEVYAAAILRRAEAGGG